MINGTPVLDIKPYIPQYDYPGITQLNLRENCESTICNLGNHETDTNYQDSSNRLENMNERIMDGEENVHTGYIPNIMPSENSR